MGRRPVALSLGVALALALALPATGAEHGTITRTRLANGLTILIRENPTAPVVAVSLAVRMGTRWETPENAGISHFLQLMLVRGTASRSGVQIVEDAERLGGKIDATGDQDWSEIEASALSRSWLALLELVADVALRPSLPDGTIEGVKQFLLGGLAPGLTHPDYPAVKVLSTVLGGGMAGRFFSEIRDKQALAYSTGALHPRLADTGYFVVQLGTAPENLSRAEASLTKELERIRQEPPSAEELRVAKAYLLGNLAMDRRTNARQAWYLATFELAGVGYEFLDRYVAAVKAVTPADVQRVARAYLATVRESVARPPTGPRSEPK